MAQCLALQWCAESSRAEISAASPGYQRETSFVNSSPTVSRLHSWLTALCLLLPSLHAVSKALVLPPASFPCLPSIASLSSSALITAHRGSHSLQRWAQTDKSTYTHKQTPKHYKISDPLAFGAITVHWLPTPSLIFIFLYHCITLILLYLLHMQFPTKPPDPLIPRWVNCSSCPWPQPFVAITPDFLRGPDLIWPYQSHYTAPFCNHQRELSPFRPRDCAGEHRA